MLEGAIVRPLRGGRETAGRELPAAEVIAQAIATGAFLRTGFITAVARFLIFFYTIHLNSKILDYW